MADIPVEYPFSNIDEIHLSLFKLSNEIVKCGNIAQIKTLEEIKKILMIKLQNLDSHLYESKIFKIPSNVTALKPGENLKNYLSQLKKICIASGNVPDQNIINVLAVNVPVNSDLDIFISNNLLEKGYSWSRCEDLLLSKFKVEGQELMSFYKLMDFEFDEVSDFDSEKNRFTNILNNTKYSINDQFILDIFIKKLPKSIFSTLNNQFKIQDFSDWTTLQEAISICNFKINTSGQIDTAESTSQKNALTFYSNKTNTASSVSSFKLPKNIKPICISYFVNGGNCTNDNCTYDHTESNFVKACKYLSSLIHLESRKSGKNKNKKNGSGFTFLSTTIIDQLRSGKLLTFYSDSKGHFFAMDSGSNINIACSSDILTNQRNIEPKPVRGIGESLSYSKILGKIGQLDHVYLLDELPIHILSLSSFQDNPLFNVTLDSSGFKLFWKNSSSFILFQKDKNGLYLCESQVVIDFMNRGRNSNIVNKMSFNAIENSSNLSSNNTLTNNFENKSLTKCTKNEMNIIKFLSKLHISLCHPGKSMFLKTIQHLSNHIIKLCPTFKPTQVNHYLNLLEQLLGKCIICSIGTAIVHPETSDAFRANTIGQKIHSDIIYFGADHPYALFVDEYSQTTFIKELKSKSNNQLIKCISEIKSKFELFKHVFGNLYTDHENVFISVKLDLEKLGIKLIAASPGNHESLSERKTRQLREKMLVTLHSLFYHMPEFFLHHLIVWVTQTINITCTTKLDSKFTPRSIFVNNDNNQIKLHHLGVYFGQPVFFKEVNRSGKLDSKVSLGIVLGRDLDSMGNFHLFNIDNKSFVWRRDIILNVKIDQIIHDTIVNSLKEFKKYNYKYKPLFNGLISKINHNNFGTAISSTEYQSNQTSVPSRITDEETSFESDCVRDKIHSYCRTIHNVFDDISSDQDIGSVVTLQNNPDHDNNPDHQEQQLIQNDEALQQEHQNDNFDLHFNQNISNMEQQAQIDEIEQKDSHNNLYYPVNILYKLKIQGTNNYKYRVHYVGFPDDQDGWASKHQLTGFSSQELKEVPTKYHYDKMRLIDNSGQNEQIDANNQSLFASTACLNFMGFCFSSISLAQSIKSDRQLTYQAAREEIAKLVDMDTFCPIDPKCLNSNIFKKTVLSFLFFKEKRNTNNVVTKYKCRLVANGAAQEVETYDPNYTYCPTIKRQSLFVIMNIALFYDMEILTSDIGNAFIESDIPQEVYIKLDAYASKLIAQDIKVEWACYLTYSGCMYFRLKKAIYGLIQAPALWNAHLTKILKGFGFSQSTMDPCVFFKNSGSNNSQSLFLVGVHIDDLICCTRDKQELDSFGNYLISSFKKVTINTEQNNIEYLGLRIVRNRSLRMAEIDQTAYIKRFTQELEVKNYSNFPVYSDLFNKALLTHSYLSVDEEVRKSYLQKLMKVNYVSYSRPDIVTSMSLLSSRTHCLTKHDFELLNKLLGYMNSTMDLRLVLRPKSLDLCAFSDASYALHKNSMVGQSGIIISFGPLDSTYNGLIISKSVKQKSVAKSTFEAELIALNETCDEVLWLRRFTSEIRGISFIKPSAIYVDNLPTINAITKENSNAKRRKHMDVRYFFMREHIKNGNIELKHIDSEYNIADFNTKILSGGLFYKFRNLILNKRDI
jgi:hypothetical protein